MTRKIASHVGSTLDEFLAEQGVLEETTAIAIKRVIAWQLAEAMKAEKLTKKAMAERMHTSRAHLDRLLNASDTGMTLETMARAAQALGRRLRVEFVAA
jgi:methylphosphotriester-DNA--protein-cysteine methyltransferase